MTLEPLSDERLREAILARFAHENHAAFTNLRVGVLNGVAHLAGMVSSIEAYFAAAEITESVNGVRGVVNRIEAPGAPSPSRRIEIKLSAKTSWEAEIMQNKEVMSNPSAQKKGETK